MNSNKILGELLKNRIILKEILQKIVEKYKFRYETFGKDIEDHFVAEIIKLLKAKKLVKNDSDFKKAKDKNEFPDLTLFTNPALAFEIKSGNRFKILSGKWYPCKNSENDMGTLNKWREKLKKFNGENIYYFFIEYAFTEVERKIIDLKIDHFYKFLGLNKDGFLKYREKDGNLRPKDFDATSPIRDLTQFENLLPGTIEYRSKRIIKKHFQYISKKEKPNFLKDLGKTNYKT